MSIQTGARCPALPILAGYGEHCSAPCPSGRISPGCSEAQLHPSFHDLQNHMSDDSCFVRVLLLPKLAWSAGIIEDGSGAPTGTPMSDPPLIEMISEDPVLRNTKLISEAWDCDGLFQVRARLHPSVCLRCLRRPLPSVTRSCPASFGVHATVFWN